MAKYTQEDLKNLVKYLEERVQEEKKDKDADHTKLEPVTKLVKQIQAIRYNPLLFSDICKYYEVDYLLMGCPTEELPLHINDKGYLSQILIKWRLSHAK